MILGIVELGVASNEIRFPELFLLQFHLPPPNMLCWTRNFFHDRWGSVFVFPSNILPKKFKKRICATCAKNTNKNNCFILVWASISHLSPSSSVFQHISYQRGFVIVANSKNSRSISWYFPGEREKKEKGEKRLRRAPYKGTILCIFRSVICQTITLTLPANQTCKLCTFVESLSLPLFRF